MKMIRRWGALLVWGLCSQEAAAQVTDRVRFEFQPVILSEVVSETSTTLTLRIASNTPFAIESNGYLGPLSADTDQAGPAAQLPSQSSQCTVPTGTWPERVFVADRRTAAQPGSPSDQAITVTFTFEDGFRPSLNLVPLKDSTAQDAADCNDAVS